MPLVGLGGAVPAPVGTWEPLGPDTLLPLFGGGGPHRLVLQWPFEKVTCFTFLPV